MILRIKDTDRIIHPNSNLSWMIKCSTKKDENVYSNLSGRQKKLNSNVNEFCVIKLKFKNQEGNTNIEATSKIF